MSKVSVDTIIERIGNLKELFEKQEELSEKRHDEIIRNQKITNGQVLLNKAMRKRIEKKKTIEKVENANAVWTFLLIAVPTVSGVVVWIVSLIQ